MTEQESALTVHLTLTSEPTSARIPMKISKSITAKELRIQVSETTKIPFSSLKVIVRGRLVGDDDVSMVESFKLEEGSVLHCMGKPVNDEEQPPRSTVVASLASTVSVSEPPTSSSTPSTASAPAFPSENPLQAALAAMRTLNSPADYLTGVTTLEKILSNITSHPMEEKYRRVKVQNAAFQKRLGGLPGGDAVMKAVGFIVEADVKDGEDSYVLRASAEAWLKLMSCKTEVEQAVLAAKSASALPPNSTAPVPVASVPSTINPLQSWPGGNATMMANPAMQQAMAQLMSDPNQLQALLQNPMFQNAMRRDPRLANDPMMLQAIESLASNPSMMNHISQMMQNPEMLLQMQSMMAAGGSAPRANGGWPSNQGSSGAAVGGSVAPATTNSPAVSDEEMTEEEMIAEAIRRSLQDGQ